MDTKEEQIAITERLQMKLLKRFEDMLDANEITSTDIATLCRLLSQNGWVLDPSRVPKGLLSKLTARVPVEELNGGKVLPFVAKQRA